MHEDNHPAILQPGRLGMHCIECNIRQVLQISDRLSLSTHVREALMRDVLAYLSTADYGKSNPEIMGRTWQIILAHTGNPDPYRETRHQYNENLTAHEQALEKRISSSGNPFQTALKMAIAGNLIDFAARVSFTYDLLLAKLAVIEAIPLAIDDTRRLSQALGSARSLLYLGDNCGEIVLDKLFLRQIHRMWPALRLRFGVRGQPVINDITLADAYQVDMPAVAEIVSNGDDSPGTVLSRVSPEFLALFNTSDVIIAKGQGNYESLNGLARPGLFHLFMAKCPLVANGLGVDNESIVCVDSSAQTPPGKSSPRGTPAVSSP